MCTFSPHVHCCHCYLCASQLAVGQIVMVNYNPDHPRQRGFWYDGIVTRKVSWKPYHSSVMTRVCGDCSGTTPLVEWL